MTGAWMRFVLAAAVACVIGFPPAASALDAPHDPYACSECHTPHGASYPGQLAFLCEKCHFNGGPAPAVDGHSSLTTDDGYGDWDVKCWGCHDPHTQRQDEAYGTSYGKFIRKILNTPIYLIDPNDPGPYWEPLSTIRTVTSTDVEFTSSTGFVDNDASASDDICQVCHVSTTNFNTGAAFLSHTDYGPDSQPGGACKSCHPHTGGFTPSSCVGCHASTQPLGTGDYRRQVVGTGGDFERTSHHVTDGTTTEIVTDADCVVCHDQGSHQSNTDPQVLLNDPDGGASYTYDGAGASIEGFCLNCHDANSSTAFDSDGDSGDGYQPFSDGRDPPDIATGWAAASHGLSAVSQLAGDKCLACHGGVDGTRTETVTDHDAHGSAFASIRSELVAGEVVANPEEALCFACHDADGPALADVEARFSGAIRWVTAAVGSGNSTNVNLNDRHDVQDGAQSVSGAKIECTDCHDPHSATAVAPLKDDPDPTDGRAPGSGTILAGADFMTEWCLDCHDGSFPASVTPPTTALTNVRSTFQNDDNHGLPSRNPTLKAGYGWAQGDLVPCLACHTEHHVSSKSNLFQLVDLVKSKDGTTDIPSDNVGLNYEVTDNNVESPSINGYEWCNTCHTGSMGGQQDNCFACHYHGTRF